MPKKCMVCQTYLHKENVSFFKVPSDPYKKKRWSANCGVELRSCEFVCEKHFRKSDFISAPGEGKSARLMPCAVPYAKIKTSASIRRRVPEQTISAGHAKSELMEEPAIEMDEEVDEIVQRWMNAAPAVTHVDRSTETDFLESHDILIVMDLKAQVKKLHARVKKLEEELQASNKLNAGINGIFTEGQIRKLQSPNKNIHWSCEDISSAICLHAAGPRTYKHLYNKGFPVPCVSTLTKWAAKVDFEAGILHFAIASLKNACELSADQKICVLSFDEMKIASTYEYDPSSNELMAPCKYVQVAMVRGLKASWKQPVFYAFDCKMTKNVLHSLICALYEVGYPVVSVVSDMSPTNQTLWKELGVSVDKTWFENPANAEEKIFVFADAPHLLKLIRNHFLDSGLVRNNTIVNAKTIKEVMQHTSVTDVSIVFKLTENHLTVNNAGRQNFKLAAQLLSNTTANAIRSCYCIGKEIYNPTETADFIEEVNDWFDVFNSKLSTASNIPSKQPYGKELSSQNEVLQKITSMMEKPIIPNKKSLASFQRGILMCNTSLPLLLDYVFQNFDMSYIPTYRLNKDILEHFFAAIRSKGGLHDDPSPMQFKYRMRRYLLEQQQEEQPLQEEGSQQEIVVISSGQQRLIPLTTEIQRAMMDFNGSQSSTSLSEKPFYNTFSITSLVREEVHNILKELTISDQFIRKEEIDDLIERCLKEKVTIVQEDDTKTTTTPSASDTNQEIEVTVEMLNENDKNKLIVENFQILEQRITNLEERISQLLQAIPKLRNASTKKFKINTEAIREELKQFMDKMDLVHVLNPCNIALQKVEQQQRNPSQQQQLQQQPQQHGDTLSFYDQMYYEQRQHNLNLLNYKKSLATLELNKRAHLNPKIKPLNAPFPMHKYEPKLRSMFLCSNN